MFATAELRQHRPRMSFVARLSKNEAVALRDRVGGENERRRRGEGEKGRLIVKLFADGGRFSIGKLSD
jgi:hypothetical protein